jgi:CheY-like chemotaxis protein
MNILIIDDDLEDTSILCEVLKELMPAINCVITHNCSKMETIFADPHQLPKLIFIDGHMYPVDGKECLIKIKKLIQGSSSRIIVYSGSLGPDQIEEFKALGADEVMIKANNYESLRHYLKNVVEKYLS